MNCPSCHQPLVSPKSPINISICSSQEHYFVFNNKDNFWLLRTKVNNVFAYVGYDSNYFTMLVKGPGEIPIINLIAPFKVEDSNILLNRFIKLIAFS